MDNPFEEVVVASKKARVKRKFTLVEMFDFFPEESENTKKLKLEMAQKVKEANPKMNDVDVFRSTQLLFNKYFYNCRFNNEQDIDRIVSSIPYFEVFKTI